MSGVTLAPEGGAHQSTITASVGLELPNVTFIEPAYAVALDWLLCGALQSVAATASGPLGPALSGREPAETGSYYFRLTTRGIDQQPFQAARDRLGDAILRRQVLAGFYAYRLVDATRTGAAGAPEQGAPPVYLVGTGAVMPEVLAAAAELADEGIAATVVDVDLRRTVLYRAWQRTPAAGRPDGDRAVHRPAAGCAARSRTARRW